MRKYYRGLEYHKLSLLFILSLVMLVVIVIASCTESVPESTESVPEPDTIKVDTIKVDENSPLLAE